MKKPRLPSTSGRGFLAIGKWMLPQWMLLLSLGTVQAQPQSAVYQVGRIRVAQLRAPPTPPNAATGAVYLWINNGGSKADSLLAVSSPIAGKAEIHRTTLKQGIMQMRPVAGVDLPPGATVKIEPGALHIMLQGLKQPLTLGSAFSLTLEFRDAGMLVVQVPVKALE